MVYYGVLDQKYGHKLCFYFGGFAEKVLPLESGVSRDVEGETSVQESELEAAKNSFSRGKSEQFLMVLISIPGTVFLFCDPQTLDYSSFWLDSASPK
ncbi:MAG: hypothetical protein EAZ77_17900 [Nostocales cyanobacterium]|nr:MAG: hypothetical protein EAZ77_17900 [Nostocales cyanobacterium]